MQPYQKLIIYSLDAFTAQHLREMHLWESEKLVLVPQGNVS